MTEPGAQPAPRGTVLVVEDEPPIAELISLYLQREGFTVVRAGDGVAALSSAKRLRPAAIVLDVGLPEIDGTEVCRRLRASGDWTPVLFCTARDDEVDRVLGLEMGGDDYITKPFSPRELVARVKAAIRRAEGPAAASVLDLGRVTIDRDTRRVFADGEQVELTATEFDLLSHLAAKPGHVFARGELLAQIWGYPDTTDTRTVDVHIAQLRAKLAAASPIRTVRGVGYSVEPAANPYG